MGGDPYTLWGYKQGHQESKPNYQHGKQRATDELLNTLYKNSTRTHNTSYKDKP